MRRVRSSSGRISDVVNSITSATRNRWKQQHGVSVTDYRVPVSHNVVDGDLAMSAGLRGPVPVLRRMKHVRRRLGVKGQGFFITVYPDPEVLFLGWVTFDTVRPSEDVTANLGDPGHRWLTAQGKFSGSQAELAITNTLGGVFDSDTPEVTSEPYGSILIQFENCESGTIIYDIPSLQFTGYIPIQRVAPDQLGQCASPE